MFNYNQVLQLIVSGLAYLASKYGFNLDASTSSQITLGITLLLNHFLHGGTPTPPPAVPASTNTATRANSVILGLAFAGLLAFAFTGCKSAPANVYKAETATDTAVATAMSVWGDYVAANHPPVAQEMQVQAAFQKIKAAELTVESANELLIHDAGNTNLVAVIADNTATELQAYNDLIALLQSFGVKL